MKLIKTTSDWGPDNGDYREYVKPRGEHQEQRYVQDIIRHQNDLCYVDVDIGRAGHLTTNSGVRGNETTDLDLDLSLTKARQWVLPAARR